MHGLYILSEGSPENTFVLVENYNMTTLSWPWLVREYLEPLLTDHLSSSWLACTPDEEGSSPSPYGEDGSFDGNR